MIEAIKSVAPPPPAGGDRTKSDGGASAPARSQATSEGVSQRPLEAVEQALKTIDPPLMGKNERLSIVRDEETGTFIYRSVDRQTGEVVNQWPAESMLQFKAYIREATGIAVNRKV